MASGLAGLLSSMAPDTAGLDKIIGVPPGTAMFYHNQSRLPHASLGGYGMAEDARYARQIDQYMKQWNAVNDQRYGITQQLLGQEDVESLRRLLSNTHGKNVDAGLASTYSPRTREIMGMDPNNPAVGAMLDESDQQAVAQRNADTLLKAGTGLNQAREGGFAPSPSIAGLVSGLGSSVRGVMPTRVAAAAAGNNGGGGGGLKMTLSRNPILGDTTKIVGNPDAVGAWGKANPDTSSIAAQAAAAGTGVATAPTELDNGTPTIRATAKKMQDAGIAVDPHVVMMADGMAQLKVSKNGQTMTVIIDQDGQVYEGTDDPNAPNGPGATGYEDN